MKAINYLQVLLPTLIFSFCCGCGPRSKPRTGPHSVIVLEMDTLSSGMRGKSNPANLQHLSDTVIQIIKARLVKMGVNKDSMEVSAKNNLITYKFWHLNEQNISLERLRKALQASAKLGFWETYDAPGVIDSIFSHTNENDSNNKIIRQMLQGQFAINKYPQNTAEIGYAHLKDTERIDKLLKKMPNLPSDIHFCWGIKAKEGSDIHSLYLLKGKEPSLSNQIIDKAEATRDDNSGSYLIEVTMNNTGALKWDELTKKNTGKDIAITLDDLVYICPRVMSEISGGRVQITGSYSKDEARDLAAVLAAGYLPVPVRIVAENMEQ